MPEPSPTQRMHLDLLRLAQIATEAHDLAGSIRRRRVPAIPPEVQARYDAALDASSAHLGQAVLALREARSLSRHIGLVELQTQHLFDEHDPTSSA